MAQNKKQDYWHKKQLGYNTFTDNKTSEQGGFW